MSDKTQDIDLEPVDEVSLAGIGEDPEESDDLESIGEEPKAPEVDEAALPKVPEGTRIGDVTSALWETLVRSAREKLHDAGYPIPKKPKVALEALVVPEDVEQLGAIQLANLLLQYQGWFSYATAQLAFARSDAAAFDEFYEVELGKKMHSISIHADSRPVKEVLKALAVEYNPLKGLHRKKVELGMRSSMIDGLVQSLGIQCRALTNEQIRRHAAQKIDAGQMGGQRTKGDF